MPQVRSHLNKVLFFEDVPLKTIEQFFKQVLPSLLGKFANRGIFSHMDVGGFLKAKQDGLIASAQSVNFQVEADCLELQQLWRDYLFLIKSHLIAASNMEVGAPYEKFIIKRFLKPLSVLFMAEKGDEKFGANFISEFRVSCFHEYSGEDEDLFFAKPNQVKRFFGDSVDEKKKRRRELYFQQAQILLNYAKVRAKHTKIAGVISKLLAKINALPASVKLPDFFNALADFVEAELKPKDDGTDEEIAKNPFAEVVEAELKPKDDGTDEEIAKNPFAEVKAARDLIVAMHAVRESFSPLLSKEAQRTVDTEMLRLEEIAFQYQFTMFVSSLKQENKRPWYFGRSVVDNVNVVLNSVAIEGWSKIIGEMVQTRKVLSSKWRVIVNRSEKKRYHRQIQEIFSWALAHPQVPGSVEQLVKAFYYAVNELNDVTAVVRKINSQFVGLSAEHKLRFIAALLKRKKGGQEFLKLAKQCILIAREDVDRNFMFVGFNNTRLLDLEKIYEQHAVRSSMYNRFFGMSAAQRLPYVPKNSVLAACQADAQSTPGASNALASANVTAPANERSFVKLDVQKNEIQLRGACLRAVVDSSNLPRDITDSWVSEKIHELKLRVKELERRGTIDERQELAEILEDLRFSHKIKKLESDICRSPLMQNFYFHFVVHLSSEFDSAKAVAGGRAHARQAATSAAAGTAEMMFGWVPVFGYFVKAAAKGVELSGKAYQRRNSKQLSEIAIDGEVFTGLVKLVAFAVIHLCEKNMSLLDSADDAKKFATFAAKKLLHMLESESGQSSGIITRKEQFFSADALARKLTNKPGEDKGPTLNIKLPDGRTRQVKANELLMGKLPGGLVERAGLQETIGFATVARQQRITALRLKALEKEKAQLQALLNVSEPRRRALKFDTPMRTPSDEQSTFSPDVRDEWLKALTPKKQPTRKKKARVRFVDGGEESSESRRVVPKHILILREFIGNEKKFAEDFSTLCAHIETARDHAQHKLPDDNVTLTDFFGKLTKNIFESLGKPEELNEDNFHEKVKLLHGVVLSEAYKARIASMMALALNYAELVKFIKKNRHSIDMAKENPAGADRLVALPGSRIQQYQLQFKELAKAYSKSLPEIDEGLTACDLTLQHIEESAAVAHKRAARFNVLSEELQRRLKEGDSLTSIHQLMLAATPDKPKYKPPFWQERQRPAESSPFKTPIIRDSRSFSS